MSALLEKAVNEARKLSEEDQDALGAALLDEMDDERRWDETFARSPGKLAALAARAAEQVKGGDCRAVGFDEL